MNRVNNVNETVRELGIQTLTRGQILVMRGRAVLRDKKGQGTAEYAILVGVLVVVAITAIVVLKPKLKTLWDTINTSMGKLK